MVSEQGQQPSFGEEVFQARFVVHLPPTQAPPSEWEDKSREGRVLSLLSERNSPGFQHLNNLVQQVVRSNLGDEFVVSNLRISRGTIVIEFDILAAAGFAVYEFIKNYPDFRQGVIQLREDLRRVITNFFFQAAGQSDRGGDRGVVAFGGLTPAPAMQRALPAPTQKDTVPSGGDIPLPRSPGSESGPLVWYLIISNTVLLLFLAILLVWSVALLQS